MKLGKSNLAERFEPLIDNSSTIIGNFIQKTKISATQSSSPSTKIQFLDKVTVYKDNLSNNEGEPKNHLEALLKAKKKIQKALIVAKFTKDTRKQVKNSDIRKQINTARDLDFKPLPGISRELNQIAKQMEEIHNYN